MRVFFRGTGFPQAQGALFGLFGRIQSAFPGRHRQFVARALPLFAHAAIADGFKLLHGGGPHDNPRARALHGAVYASTDSVALDTVGVDVIDRVRKEEKVQSLSAAGLEPRYIRAGDRLKVGEGDLNKIRLSKRYI